MTEGDDELKKFHERLRADGERFERREARSRRVAFAFLPLYAIGGVLFTWGWGRVLVESTKWILLAGFLLTISAQWAQTVWLEHLKGKRGGNAKDPAS